MLPPLPLVTQEHDITPDKVASRQHYDRPENVRLAGPDDEDALYDLLCALEDDNGFGIPKDEEKIRDVIRKGTQRQGNLIGVIDGKKGQYGEGSEIAGSVCLMLTQLWYSNEWILAEQWLFVRPEYRSNHFDRDLFQYAKWCHQEMVGKTGKNMPLMMSVSSPDRLQAKLRLWSRHGKQVGGIFEMSA